MDLLPRRPPIPGVTVGTDTHLPTGETTPIPVPTAANEQAFDAPTPHHGTVFDVLVERSTAD